MSEAALGFAQTPEGNYDSILKAQSQANRQAGSMQRAQMAQIQRAEVRAIKEMNEQQERVEELQSDAIITYSVPKHSDIIGELALDIGVQDTKGMMARANRGLYPTAEQVQAVAQHEGAIKSFANQLDQEIRTMQTRGYFNVPAFKEVYKGYLTSLQQGEVSGFEPTSIIDGAPSPFAYMYGTQDAFRPLNDETFSKFLIEPKYWSYWFDKNSQDQSQTIQTGETQGATNTPQKVGATTNQFSVVDSSLQKIRPKTADEIISEGLLDSWFSNKENYEGSLLLRQGAMQIIAENKALEAQGIGSNFLTIDGTKIKISDIDPADNGNPLSFTYLMAQTLSDRVYEYGMDNTSLNVSDIERMTLSIINNKEKTEVNDKAYTNKFTQLAKVYNNDGGVLNSSVTKLVNGVATKDLGDIFPAAKYQNKTADVYFNPTNKTFILQYEESVKGRKVTRTTNELTLNEFAEATQLFPGYSWPTASKVLARNKAFNEEQIDVDAMSGSDPQEVTGLESVYEQVSTEWIQATSADTMTSISRGVKTMLRTYDYTIPTKIGNIKGISINSEKDQTFDVRIDVDGTTKTQVFTIDQLKALGAKIGLPSMGSSSSIDQMNGLPLDPEQLKLLNKLT